MIFFVLPSNDYNNGYTINFIKFEYEQDPQMWIEDNLQNFAAISFFCIFGISIVVRSNTYNALKLGIVLQIIEYEQEKYTWLKNDLQTSISGI